MWELQMPTLTSHYRVVRYDTRGHGDTEVTDGEYTLDLLANDLFGLLDGLELNQVHYIGLSMGGMIGQTAALQDASRFLSLSLCDTSSRIPLEARSAWNDRINLAQREGMEALVPSTIDRWFSTRFQAQRANEVDKVREMIRSTAVNGFCGCAAAIRDLDLTDRLATIDLPTLLIVGEDDPGTPVSAHEVIRDCIENSELVVIPDALHFSNVEQADLFNTALGGFLKRQGD
jgi:3-oxoadipate enol-lactonase